MLKSIISSASCLLLLMVHTTPARSDDSMCGLVPALPTTASSTQKLKRELAGQADLLSKLIGKAELGGQIETEINNIYQQSEAFFAAQSDAYLAYMFCSLVMQNNTLSIHDKIDAIRQYRDAPVRAKKGVDGSDAKHGALSPDEGVAIRPNAESLKLMDMLIGQRKYKEALSLVENAARFGDPDTQVALGVLYTTGLDGIQMQPEKAFGLFKAAANEGSASALGRLGLSYFKGQGTQQNISEAIRYSKLGADRNDPLSLDNMGYFNEHGIGGLPVDLCKAVRYYKNSSDLNAGVGKFSLSLMYIKGSCVPKDYTIAQKLLESSAALGNPDAAEGLKMMKDKGLIGN